MILGMVAFVMGLTGFAWVRSNRHVEHLSIDPFPMTKSQLVLASWNGKFEVLRLPTFLLGKNSGFPEIELHLRGEDAESFLIARSFLSKRFLLLPYLNLLIAEAFLLLLVAAIGFCKAETASPKEPDAVNADA